jgi:hypothetical protein
MEGLDLKFSFSTHKALSHVTDYDVHMAYDFFLGRPPENPAVIDSHKKLQFHGLVRQFIQSDEFMDSVYNKLLNKVKISRLDNTLLPSRRQIAWITEIITFEEDEIKGFFLAKTWDDFFGKFLGIGNFDKASSPNRQFAEKPSLSEGLVIHALQSNPVYGVNPNSGRVDVGDEWPTLAALFMENYYLRISGNDSRNRTDALRHFARVGLASGLSPSPLFESTLYLDRAVEAGLPLLRPGEPALLHWMRHGAPARIVPTTLFDEAFYRSVYSDVPSERFGFDHFIAAGLQEDRQPNRWFDPAWYRATTTNIPPGYSAFMHFLESGAEAGLLPHRLFVTGHLSGTSLADWSAHGAAIVARLETMIGQFGKWAIDLLLSLFYPAYYSLVVSAAAAMSPLEQLSHFLTHGIEQDIPPSPLFEPDTYRRAWRDSTGEEMKGTNSLLHWLQGGHEVVAVPTRMFSDTYYRARYPDMADSSIDSFQHYLRLGIQQNREPNCWFEPNWYMSSAGSYSHDADPSYIQCLTRGGGGARASRVLWLLSGAPPFIRETPNAILDQIESLGQLLAATEPWLNELSAEQVKIAALLFAPETYTGNHALSPATPPIEKLAHFLKYDLATGERTGPLFIAEVYAKNAESYGESINIPFPLLHFLKFGIERRIVPNPIFNVKTYLHYNKDLKEFDNWLFLHFIRDGLYEGRLYSSRSELHLSLGFSMNSV